MSASPYWRLRRIFLALLLSALSVFNSASQAQELLDPPPVDNDHMWDCWISTDDAAVVTYFIRCIRDREVAPPEPPPDSVQGVLLDLIHERIHLGQTEALDVDLAAGRLEEVLSHIWRIRIHQYPYEESWEQERPQLLVQSLLCSSTPDCLVLLYR